MPIFRPSFAPAPLALAIFLALGAPHAVHAQGAPGAVAVADVAIAAQPLSQALSELARQTRTTLVASPALLAGKTAPAVAGKMSTRQALDRLLAGSGLAADIDGAAVTVRSAQATPPPGAASLPAVTVTASAEQPGELPQPFPGGQVARGAGLGLLGDTDIMDAPFNITSYTAKTVEDQQARNIADLLGHNDPSVRVTGGEGNDTDVLRIRGFDVPMEDSSFNGLPGLLSYYRSDTSFVERIEVLKGPSAMLNGMSPSGATGGAVNVIPKRAGDEALTRLTTSYLSDSRFGVHADVGRRFGENNEWGIRANGLLRQGETARDFQQQDQRVGALALDYRGERVRASVDYVDQSAHDNASRTGLTVGPATAGVALAPPSGKTNFSQPWALVDSGNRALMGRVEVDIAPDVTAYAALGRSKGRFDGIGAGNIALTSVAGDTRGSAGGSAFHLDTKAADVGVRGKLQTGPVTHQWSVAATYLDREMAYGFSPSAGTILSNIYTPTYYPEPMGILPGVAKPASETELPSFGLADTLSFADDNVRLTLGLRRQTVRATNFNLTTGAVASSYDESAVTPFAGLLVRAWAGGALYANYIEGLAQGDTAPIGASNAGEAFAPYKSKQYELGVKQEWNGFGGTVSLFQIAKASGLLDVETNRYDVNGEQRHRGIEANFFGELAPGIRLLGGAAWIDAKLTSTSVAAAVGNRPIGVPELTANLGGEWDIPGAPGLTLTAAAIYTGSSYVDASNATLIPGWTRADLGLRWVTRVADKGVTFRAALENAFDKRYWSVGTYNSLQLGMPRTLALSASVDF